MRTVIAHMKSTLFQWSKMEKYPGFEIQKSLAKNLTLLFTVYMIYYTT